MRLHSHLTLLANALVSEQPNAIEVCVHNNHTTTLQVFTLQPTNTITTQDALVQILATTFNIELDSDSPRVAGAPPPPTPSTYTQRCSAEEEQLWASLRPLMRNACASASLTSLASALGLLLAFSRICPSQHLTAHDLRTLTTARRSPQGPVSHARYARFASILSEGLCIALHKERQDLADMLLWHGANPFRLQTGAYVRLGEVDESGAYFGTSVAFSATALAIAKGHRGAVELLSSRMPFVGWVKVKVYRGNDALLKAKKKQDWALRWMLVAPVHDDAGALVSLSLFLFSANQGDLHSLTPCSVVRFLKGNAVRVSVGSQGQAGEDKHAQGLVLVRVREGGGKEGLCTLFMSSPQPPCILFPAHVCIPLMHPLFNTDIWRHHLHQPPCAIYPPPPRPQGSHCGAGL